MRLAVTLCAALLLCTLWAGAEELTEQQRSSLDTSALEQTAPEELSGVDALSLSDLTEGLNRLKETVLEEAASVVEGAVSAAGKLLLIVLLCSVAESAADAAGGMSAQAVRLCGAAGVTLTAFGDLNALVGLGKETIERLSVFTTALIPTLTTAAAASGGLTSAPARQAATLLFSNILTGLISSVLLPLTYVYAAAPVASQRPWTAGGFKFVPPSALDDHHSAYRRRALLYRLSDHCGQCGFGGGCHGHEGGSDGRFRDGAGGGRHSLQCY